VTRLAAVRVTLLLLLWWGAAALSPASSAGQGLPAANDVAAGEGGPMVGAQGDPDWMDAAGGTVTDWLGNIWTRAGSPDDVGGAGEANWYIDQLAKGDASVLQYAVDRYYLTSSLGISRRWGKGWLAKYIVAVLLMRGFELHDQLSEQQLEAIDRLAVDALDETTFRIDGCGVLGNSCAEDFGSMMAVAAIARNLYPGVVAQLGSEEIGRIEKKYFTLALSTRNRFFGLVRETSQIDGQEYVMVQNHSGQSAVYSAIVLTELGNALQAYLVAGRRIPSFYLDDPDLVANLRSLMAWIQTTALPDGSAFVEGCLQYGTGRPSACNDPQFANTVPTFVPAGRAVALLLGKTALGPGYGFLRFEPYDGGNSGNAGRRYLYDDLNPGPSEMGLSVSLANGQLLVQWSNPDAHRCDVWGPSGRVGWTTGASMVIDLGGASGRIPYGVVMRTGSGLAAGFQIAQVEHFLPRRHLDQRGR